MPKKQTHSGHQDSKTGEFVPKDYAEKHPKTTQRESIPTPGKGDTDRGKK
jgi:hypothetical protein